MGVMSCSRNGCENVMCDTYVYNIGYICADCQDEFKKYIEAESIDLECEGEIEKNLKIFIATEKDFYTKGKKISIDDFFRVRTRN